jgi:plasmid stabilization system protein ParE
MGKEVAFSEAAKADLQEILAALIIRHYFGFVDSAKAYVDRLRHYARQNVGKPPIREAPLYFRRYGENLKYIVYRVSRTTSWYIFYQEEGDRYVIQHITNNHRVAQYF